MEECDRPSEVVTVPARRVPSILLADAREWSVGQWIRIGGSVMRIVAMSDGQTHGKESSVELEHVQTKERRRAPMSALRTLKPGIDFSILSDAAAGKEMVDLLVEDNKLRKEIDRLPTDGLSTPAKAELIRRLKWVNQLHAHGFRTFQAYELTELEIAFMAKEAGLPTYSAETLQEWEALGSRDASKLIPNFDQRGGPGLTRADSTSHLMLADVLIDARDEKKSVLLRPTDLLREHRARIDKRNAEPGCQTPIPYISLSTLTRVFNRNVSPYERSVARYGKKRADRMHTPTGRRPRIEFAGGVTEFDDLDTKVFCIDERSGLAWGRPWLTSGIDSAKDYLVGAHFNPDARSAISCVKAIVNSIEVKPDMSLVSEELKGITWHASGYPLGLRLDNALYNNERIATLNADVADTEWARPYTPTEKRTVEYSNGLIVRFFRDLPGRRGPLGDRDAIDEGISTAVLTYQQLRALFFVHQLRVVMKAPMGDGLSREQKYLEEGNLKLRSRFPPDTRRLRLLAMMKFPKKLKWGPGGIRAMHLTFNHPEAYRKWISRAGGSMMVNASIDDENPGYLYVEIPDSGKVLELECLDPDYIRGLTLGQHLLIVKMCAQMKRTNPSIHDLYAGFQALRLLTEQSCQSKKIRERKKSARTGELPAKTQTEAVSDVERAYEELQETEMSQSGEGFDFPDFSSLSVARPIQQAAL